MWDFKIFLAKGVSAPDQQFTSQRHQQVTEICTTVVHMGQTGTSSLSSYWLIWLPLAVWHLPSGRGQQSCGDRLWVTLSIVSLNFMGLPQTSSSGGLVSLDFKEVSVDQSKILLCLPCNLSNSWQQNKNLQCCSSLLNEWLITQVTDEESQGFANVVLQQRSGHCSNISSCWYLGHSPLAAS